MSISSWIALLTTWVVVLIVPGPDIFIILKYGVRSRSAGIKSAFGIMTGNFIWLTASVFGLGALLRSMPLLLPAVQIAGALILITIGFLSVKGGLSQLKKRGSPADPKLNRAPFALGFLTNMANPKAMLFFVALLSQFLPANPSWATTTAIIVSMWLIGLAWFLSVAFAASAPKFNAWLSKAAPVLDIVAGVVFLVVAGVILFEVLPQLISG